MLCGQHAESAGLRVGVSVWLTWFGFHGSLEFRFKMYFACVCMFLCEGDGT